MTSKKILAIGIALVLFAFIVLNTNIYHFNDSLGMSSTTISMFDRVGMCYLSTPGFSDMSMIPRELILKNKLASRSYEIIETLK